MYYTRDSRTRGQPAISVSTLAGVPILVCGHDEATNGSGLYCGDGVNHEWASVDASSIGGSPEPPLPLGLTVTPALAALEVSWDTVSATLNYLVLWKSGGQAYAAERQATVVPPTTSYTITGLMGGTEYTVKVRAFSVETEEVEATGIPLEDLGGGGGNDDGGGTGGGGGGGGPRQTVPDAPRNLLVEGGDGQVTLTWDAPEDDGGSAITDYEYRIDGRGRWISIGSTHTTHTVTGLTNGTAYVFQVRAVNAGGSSPYSNRAEATPGVGALDFAHFANGAGIISDLVFVNVATHPIRPVLYFYDQEGHLIDPESVVDLTGDLEVTEDGALSALTEMEPLGELTISTHGQGEVVSGSVKVGANGPIGGVLRFDLPGIGVAGVGASQPVKGRPLPGPPGEGPQYGSGHPQPGRGSNGGELPIDERGHRARRGGDSSGGLRAGSPVHRGVVPPCTDTSDFVGSVRCTAPGLFNRSGGGARCR